MKKFVAILLALVMVLSLVACGTTAPAATEAPAATKAPAADAPAAPEEPAKLMAEPMTFKVSFAEDPNNVVVIEMQKAFDEITAATNGDVVFEVFASGALGTITDVAEQMTLGAPIMHSFGLDGLGEYCPALNPLSCMYTFESYEEYFALLETEYWDGLMAQLREEANFHVIGTGITGWRSFISSKEFSTGDEIKGLNIRMGPAAITQGFVTLLGCSPFTSSWSENYTNIQTGIYDACEGPLSLIYSSSLYEVAPYLVLTEHTLGNALLTVSCTYWDQLPAEYQQLIEEKVADAFHRVYTQQVADDAGWVAKFEEAGATVIVPDKSTFTWVSAELLEYLGYDPAIYNEVRAAIEGAMK